jgi:23S rRNA (uracil1939-C5)-methyltransferase
MADGEDLEVLRLGARGDGMTGREGAEAFIPFALPGEVWRAEGGAFHRVSASPDRQSAVCQHFEMCGGCVAQHMSPGLYADWKLGIVAEAFRHRGLSPEIAPLVRVSGGSRRRAFFGIERTGADVTVGFREEGQHTLVNLETCPVLDPVIVSAVPDFRDMGRLVMADRQGGRLVVTRVDHGLDVSFDNGMKNLAPDVRGQLAVLAQKRGLVRLTVGGELIVQSGPATVTIGGVGVDVMPGVFLQAVPEAEALLIDLVAKAIPKRAKIVADLFSGLGTFAFPLARRVRVSAFDGDKRAITALSKAAKHAQGLKPIEAQVRDLYRDPLAVRELDAFDAVVFDPPRAGAAEQAERIAKSKVPMVVAVSCSPATLARDAKTLIDGGMTMGPVTAIDQFLFSPHVEAIAVFKR